jgi:hypothetical protein
MEIGMGNASLRQDFPADGTDLLADHRPLTTDHSRTGTASQHLAPAAKVR